MDIGHCKKETECPHYFESIAFVYWPIINTFLLSPFLSSCLCPAFLCDAGIFLLQVRNTFVYSFSRCSFSSALVFRSSWVRVSVKCRLSQRKLPYVCQMEVWAQWGGAARWFLKIHVCFITCAHIDVGHLCDWERVHQSIFGAAFVFSATAVGPGGRESCEFRLKWRSCFRNHNNPFDLKRLSGVWEI